MGQRMSTGAQIVRFADYAFVLAGIWGIVVLTPFYWLVDVTGRPYDPPTTYPHFFYGFFAVALAWQIAFLVIGSNPTRFRALMIPGLRGLLFILAFVKTRALPGSR
jgi:hypothetical protein